MASLEKRGQSFRIVFRYGDLRFSRALSTRDEKAAAGCLARLEDNLHRLKLGTLTAPDDVDLVEFLLSDGREPPKRGHKQAGSKKDRAVTLTGLFDEYFAKLPEGNLEPDTIAGMKIHQRQLERHFGKHFSISAITLAGLQGYVEKRSHDKGRNGRRVAPTTIKRAIVTLRTVWNWGRQHRLVKKPFPNKGLKYPKGQEKLPFMTFAEVERRVQRASPAERADLWECVFLSLPEIEELLALVRKRARHSFIYPMFAFAAHTGARRMEMLRSKLWDLDFEESLITIHERKKAHDKRTIRRIPMSPFLRDVLLGWTAEHPGGEATFCQMSRAVKSDRTASASVSRLSRDEAHDHFKRTLNGTKWQNLRGWHVFRHSFCSNCAAKGVDQRMIDEWVGHVSPDMVLRYRHLLPDQERAAISLVFGASNQISSAVPK